MILAKILKSEGHTLKSTNCGPDFVVEEQERKIFIEAICPGPGAESNPNTVLPIEYRASIAQPAPIIQIVLRICSALKEKKQKYVQYLKQGVVSEGDICIIAISSSKVDRASALWSPLIMRATHGLGNPYTRQPVRAEDVLEKKTAAELSPSRIRQAQEYLKAQGFDPGPIDELLGLRTIEALRQYQAKHELPVTGKLDETTLKTLDVQ
jgi:hypothetical protein